MQAAEHGMERDENRPRDKEKRKLVTLGVYLRNLSDYLLDSERGEPTSACGKIMQSDPASWDCLLHELMSATQGGLAGEDSGVFENHERVSAIAEKRLDKDGGITPG